MSKNNFPPPAGVANAVFIVKRYEAEVRRIDEAIKRLDESFDVDGRKMIYSNEFKYKRKRILNDAKYEFLKRINFYKRFYPETVFNLHYKLP